MKTIVIYSSANRHGNTATVSENYVSQHEGADSVYLDELVIHDYSYDHRHKEDDFRRIFLQVLQYDHVVFSSPVYWYAVTPRMKAFFDRITEFMDDDALKASLRQLRGKRFSILTNSISSAAPAPMLEMMIKTCEYLGMKEQAHQHFQFPVSI
ncbi:flavodoxin family protein [Pseudoalteromonas sp. MMG013]|uniref:flavodoxin family protein n=1 Tax=Pseudoalteromonas sp. MMG013 TaxID=2822687 RepID=UPI001B369A40|nr:flavodoxin family protein [Pseudoalteromonas sp. MMG013]MBQ4863706.1 flavodoxin family protein [Pseudoalteromonas sp. MMG013]